MKRKGVISSIFYGVAIMASVGLLVSCDDDQGIKPCEDGAKECVSDQVARVCADRVWIPVDCGVGNTCSAGNCMAASCEAGAVGCATDHAAKTCADDERTWVLSACAKNEVCVEGACMIDVENGACQPGERICASELVAMACNAGGLGYEEQICPETAPCQNGLCQGPVCVAGETQCATMDPLAAWMNNWNHAGTNAQLERPDYPRLTPRLLQRCIDGIRWERELCAEDEICAFDNVDPAETDRYRNEFITYEMSTYRRRAPWPTPPFVPAPAQASCHPLECKPFSVLLLSQAETPTAQFDIDDGMRPDMPVCGDPNDPEADLLLSFSICQGLLPYEAPRWVNYTCAPPMVCLDLPNEEVNKVSAQATPAGLDAFFALIDLCREIDCMPGDERCAEDGALIPAAAINVNNGLNRYKQVCGWDGHWQYPSHCGGDLFCYGEGDDYLGCVECVPDDERCVTEGGREVCDASGSWVESNCDEGLFCYGEDQSSVVCIECVGPVLDADSPTSRCVYTALATEPTDIVETCGGDNTWASATTAECTSGEVCVQSGTDLTLSAQCQEQFLTTEQ